MKLTVLRHNRCQTTEWAGGQSTQLYIYPEDADYHQKNFQFRLSSAVATRDEVSQFTDLPGITRHLLVLDGVLKVSHKDHYDLELHPYQEIDVFDGGWSTQSEGKVRDFNLMLAAGCRGQIVVLTESRQEIIRSTNTHTAFFVAEGEMQITVQGGEKAALSKGDMALLDAIATDQTVALQLEPGTKVVRAEICCI